MGAEKINKSGETGGKTPHPDDANTRHSGETVATFSK